MKKVILYISHTRDVQKVLSPTKIFRFVIYLSLLYEPHLYKKIKTEIWINFTSFGSVLPQQKCSAMALFAGWGLEVFKQPSYII